MNIINNIIDYNEIQTFIEVTMDTTAGEGDEIQNRLDNLSQLCANFSPIIFKLEAVQNLQTIFKLFSDTWKHITLEDPINTIVSFQHILCKVYMEHSLIYRMYVMDICSGISKLANFMDLWKEGQKSNWKT